VEFVLTHSLVVRFSILFLGNSDSEEGEDEGGEEEENKGGLLAGQRGSRRHACREVFWRGWVGGITELGANDAAAAEIIRRAGQR